jgi:hypothetical protein
MFVIFTQSHEELFYMSKKNEIKDEEAKGMWMAKITWKTG